MEKNFDVGRRIRTRRNILGITIVDFADMLGTNSRQVSIWEHLGTVPICFIRDICLILDVTPDFLFGYAIS
ncbi:MAG: helix-turn-helix domain-containing protein [Clostridiales bacterium]|jgi:transcriptional regulator with XRE-family HTH domain|nr:helix-turn-helix domain-containing protein [Clostridiales bacterium]